MVAHNLEGLLESRGLDPAIGFFHEPSYGRASLALDLMEVRVQKSVFEIYLESSRLNMFEEQLLAMINADTDSVRIYPLDRHADSEIRIVGRGKRIDNTGVRFI